MGDEKREERKGAKQRALGQVIPDNSAVCFAAYVSARVLRFAYEMKVKGAVMKICDDRLHSDRKAGGRKDPRSRGPYPRLLQSGE